MTFFRSLKFTTIGSNGSHWLKICDCKCGSLVNKQDIAWISFQPHQSDFKSRFSYYLPSLYSRATFDLTQGISWPNSMPSVEGVSVRCRGPAAFFLTSHVFLNSVIDMAVTFSSRNSICLATSFLKLELFVSFNVEYFIHISADCTAKRCTGIAPHIQSHNWNWTQTHTQEVSGTSTLNF